MQHATPPHDRFRATGSLHAARNAAACSNVSDVRRRYQDAAGRRRGGQGGAHHKDGQLDGVAEGLGVAGLRRSLPCHIALRAAAVRCRRAVCLQHAAAQAGSTAAGSGLPISHMRWQLTASVTHVNSAVHAPTGAQCAEGRQDLCLSTGPGSQAGGGHCGRGGGGRAHL